VTFAESDENKAQVAPRIAHGVAYKLPAPACAGNQVLANNVCVPRVNVLQTTPGGSETGVSTSASIAIYFDQDMKTDQLLRDGSITITPAIGGRIENWSSDSRSWRYVAPDTTGNIAAQLQPNTRYTITLAPNKAKAITGALLAAGWAWNFTTKASCDVGTLSNGVCVANSCTAPQVLVNGVCTTPTTTCPTGQVLQNGACVPQTTPPSSGCPSGQTLVNGVCTSPAGSVCNAPQIKVNGACITPVAGVSYPKVTSITPADKAAVRGRPAFGVKPIDTVTITFDREMDPTTFSLKLVHTATNQQTLANLTPQGNVMTFTFFNLSIPGEWKVILRGAKDKKGVVMQDFESTLNVSVDFVVTPAWASSLGQSTPVVIKFNVPVNPATINDNTILMTGAGETKWHTVSYDAATNTATVKPRGVWPGGAQMYNAVTMEVKNTAGQSVSEPTGAYETMYFIQGGAVSDPTPTTPTPPPPTKPPPSTTPGTGTGTGTGGTTDNYGCYTPQRSPACLVATTVSTSPALSVRYTNNCTAHVYVRACQRTPSGNNNCGGSGIDKGATWSWSTQGGTNPTYEFVGSTIPSNDFVCSGKDPAMTAYKQRYP
jgi:hypothetical protein